MDHNAFGKLVRAYREQRGWKQEELAERWGFTREYISQIERGKRKVEKQQHITRLADILGIPEERLVAVGKELPPKLPASRGDDLLLQALIAPAQETVKMSWLFWCADSALIDVEANLLHLEQRLTEALALYSGQFRSAAFRLLAYTYEMLGKMAMETIKTQEALAHFRSMQDVAEELGDPGLIALSLIHQAEMFRRRGWQETAFRRYAAAETYIKYHADAVPSYIKGLLSKAYSISYMMNGDEQNFLRSIDLATDLARAMEATLETANNEYDEMELLQLRAQGYTQFWQPQKALDIYTETETTRPFRPLRAQSSLTLSKAQAYCYAGETKRGRELALAGMSMAEQLHSIRYVTRIRQMCDRLSVTTIGKKPEMKELSKETQALLQKMRKEREER